MTDLGWVEEFISMLDKLAITRDPDDPQWNWGGKGDFSYKAIVELAELHGGKNESIRKHT